jgi:hypothetical protein
MCELTTFYKSQKALLHAREFILPCWSNSKAVSKYHFGATYLQSIYSELIREMNSIHQWSISIEFRFEVLALTTSWSSVQDYTSSILYVVEQSSLYIRVPMKTYHMITLTKRINKALNHSKLYLNTLKHMITHPLLWENWPYMTIVKTISNCPEVT